MAVWSTVVPRGLVVSGLVAGLLGCAVGGGQSVAVTGETSSLKGELSTRSAMNVNNGSRYQSFSFGLKGQEAVLLRQVDAVSTVLTLFDANKRLIAGPGASSLLLAPTQAGSYTVYVSGEDATSYGPFNLSVERIARLDSGLLEMDKVVAGRLNMPGNQYFFEVEQPALYSVAMRSSDFDSMLKLQGGTLKLENDDFGDGVDSQIQAFLQPGRYQITAGAVGDQPSGAFTLSMERRDLPKGITLKHGGEIVPGEVVAGFASMQPNTYQLSLKNAAYVELDMRSAEIDSMLELKGSGISVSDDDGGEQNNARLHLVLPAGTYQLSAQSVSGQAGLFELSYRQLPMRAVQGNNLRPNTYLTGAYVPQRQAQASLLIEQAGMYQLDLSSSDFDVLLSLSGNGVSLQDDDSAGGTNARIEQYLEPGVYQLAVSAVSEEGRGRYTLSARQLD